MDDGKASEEHRSKSDVGELRDRIGARMSEVEGSDSVGNTPRHPHVLDEQETEMAKDEEHTLTSPKVDRETMLSSALAALGELRDLVGARISEIGHMMGLTRIPALAWQLVNEGQIVSQSDFPETDADVVRTEFESLVAGHPDSDLIYDSLAVTLAYRNAVGVRRMHIAFRDAANPLETDSERTSASAVLIQALLLEIGLSPTLLNIQCRGDYFVRADVSSGNLDAVLPTQFPIIVATITEQSVHETHVSDIFRKAFTAAPYPKSDFCLILAPVSSNVLRLALTEPAELDFRPNIVYLDEDAVRKIITSSKLEPRAAFMDYVRSQVDLRIMGPFTEDGPTKGLVFVGRVQELYTMLQSATSRSFAVLGGRRIGKTSMLQQIKVRLEQRGYVVLDVDCSTSTTYRELYRVIQSEWAHVLDGFLPADDTPATFREMVAAIRSSRHADTPIVFVFDEVDTLLDHDMHQEIPESMFRIFRDLSQRQRCQFIFSGERRIYEQCYAASSPLFNFCTPLILGLLSHQDGKTLIEKPFELLNISLEPADEITDIIVDASSRHPNLIQWVCARLIDRLAQSASQAVITKEMVTSIVIQPAFQNRYIEVFWGQSTALERAITVLMPETGSIHPIALGRRLRQEGFPINHQQLGTAIDYLVLYSVLRRDADGVSFAAAHFPYYAKREGLLEPEYLAELRSGFLSGGSAHLGH